MAVPLARSRAAARMTDGVRRTALRIGEPGGISRFVHSWLPVILASLSWGVGWYVAAALGYADTVLWALFPTVGALLARIVLERLARDRPAGDRLLAGVFVAHQLLVLAAIVLNPLACIYAFIGYLDGPRFLTGGAVPLSIITTALLCAFGQAGGPAGAVAAPALLALLVAVNVLLSLGMGHIAQEREEQVAAREAAVAQLEQAMADNAALQEELLRRARESGAAQERTRLAREIHDTVAQGLVGVIRQLEAVPAGQLEEAARRRIATAEDTARECLVDARRAVEALGPQQLEDGAPLPEVLAGIVARWARTHRIVATFDADRAPDPCPHAHALIRITQEALSNIARHARAGSVEILLATVGSAADGTEADGPAGGGVVLRIRDDGAGFDPAAAPPGHGLASMRARVEELGGTLRIDTAPGAGCALEARIPA